MTDASALCAKFGYLAGLGGPSWRAQFKQAWDSEHVGHVQRRARNIYCPMCEIDEARRAFEGGPITKLLRSNSLRAKKFRNTAPKSKRGKGC